MIDSSTIFNDFLWRGRGGSFQGLDLQFAKNWKLSPEHEQCSNPVNGSDFSILTEGRFPTSPEEDLAFRLHDYSIPFSLRQGKIIAHTENSRWVSFRVKKGNTTIGLESEPEGGIFTYSKDQEISAGTYDDLSFEAVPRAAGSPVITQMQFLGTKSGPSDSTITFTPEGIESGTIRVIVLVNGTQALDQIVTVGSPVLPHPQPSPENTVTSPDGIATLRSEDLPHLTFLTVEGSAIPDGWEPVGDAYTIVPEGIALDPPATLFVRIPPDITYDSYRHTLFLAEYSHGAWTMLPSRIEGQNTDPVMATAITRTGTYALMALEPEPTPAPTPTPEPALGLPLLIPIIAVFIAFLISLYSRYPDRRRLP